METQTFDKLEDKINKSESLIMKAVLEDKYKCALPNHGMDFPIKDYLNLTAYQESTKKNIKIMTYLYLPDPLTYPYPKGIIYMLHGMGSYSRSHVHVAKKHSESGYVAASLDYRSYGLSEGIKGNIENFDFLVTDCEKFIKETNEHLSKRFSIKVDEGFLQNRFVSGLSMGGLLAYLISLKEPKFFKGVILYAPAFDVNVSRITRCMVKIISKVCPNSSIPQPKIQTMCKNPDYLELRDDIVKNTVSKFQTLSELIRKGDYVFQVADGYTAPFVIIIPGIDKLVPPKRMYEVYKRAKSTDKQAWYYDNLWHGVVLEPEIEEIVERVTVWMNERISN